ncbi:MULTISPECIES: zinc ribbon domain-containing protein [unclassified Solwaraspora]|uniref:zinc ribbon domain-containing protein n=1 Tax=unclassified Solwaraspora TaxID=2627926 RepID=UPI00259AF201|nr:zinc ribbon domain-containing protein [Solwaraspora sp. WMMA2056]WJK40453.1 zinc ribbon domain-containing protein [Solwaraspora sp. WMMA2056]
MYFGFSNFRCGFIGALSIAPLWVPWQTRSASADGGCLMVIQGEELAMAPSRGARREITDGAELNDVRVVAPNVSLGSLRSPLSGLLYCATCERQMIVMSRLNGRAYGAPCGCRLSPVDALTVERLVFNAVEARHPELLAGSTSLDPSSVFREVLAEVRIGGAVDELEFIWST